VAAFIKQKKLASAVIVGHSMGSTNAQCFATKYPSMAKALVLVASFADYQKAMIDDFKKLIDELQDPVDSNFVVEFQKSTITKPIGDEKLNTFIQESRKVPAHVWKGVAAGWQSANYRSALQSFTKPVLILWGDKDVYCPREDQELLHQAFRQSRMIIYEGIGHALQWENPQRCANDLTDFINSIH
jgi:pimeloyl-ACP methyl ester carboxylesterase